MSNFRNERLVHASPAAVFAAHRHRLAAEVATGTAA